jgi:aspartyl-tRNA(Asn)/glutamyl-tRNA(Gln) amidotransferase subunit A
MIKRDASAIARDVNAGRLDPLDVVDAFDAVISARNPQLNALVRYTPEAPRTQASRVSERVRAGEKPPLAGVAVIVKDNIWVESYNISQGSRLFEDFVAPADAIAVERVKAAGAILIGIGNCPEFACKGQTNSPLHGATRHPMNPALTPGGSSGGNAAALAADFAPLALGTDAGGSGRRPSAHTGTVGFKPSFGAVPYGPGFAEPFWGISVIAPMGRTVGDVALLFEAIAGPDPRDPETITIAPAGPGFDTARLRIAYSPRLGLDVPVDADVAAAIDSGVALLARAGWNISNVDPRWPAGLTEGSVMPLQAAGLAALHGDAFARDRSQFDPDVAAQIERGLSLSGREVGAALEAGLTIKRSVARFFADYDLLLCPTAPCVAWPVTQLGPARIAGVEVAARGHAVFTPFFNHAQTPAISIPCGRGRDGLPVGLQISARRGADRLVLAAAANAEKVLADVNSYSRA